MWDDSCLGPSTVPSAGLALSNGTWVFSVVVIGSHWNLAVQAQGGGEKDGYEVDFHMQGSLGKPTTEKEREIHT